MPTLPASLKPTSAYSLGSPTGAVSTEQAGGPDRTGLFFDRGQRTINVTFNLTAQQFSIWTLFFERIIQLGTIPFDMPLDTGFGVQPHSVTIVPDSCQPVRAGISWVVTFQARATGKSYDYTPEEAQALIDYYEVQGEGADELIDAIYRFANVDSLVLDF